MENISHMVDDVCKKVGTRCFPPEAKIEKELNPMLWNEEVQRSVGSRKSKKEEDESLNPFSTIENDHDPLISSSGQ